MKEPISVERYDAASMNKNHDVLIPIITNIGEDHRCRKIASTLKRYGYTPHVYCDAPVTPYRSMWEDVDLSFITRWSHTRCFLPVFIIFNLKLVFIMSVSRAGVCIVEDCPPLLTASLIGRIKGIKVIYDSHELFSETPGVNRGVVRRFFWRVWESVGIRLSRGVITVSEGIRSVLGEHFPAKRIQVLPNMPLYTAREYRKDPGLSAKSIRLLYQGALRKGSGLMDALKGIRDDERISIDVFGSGEEEAVLREYTDDYGMQERVRFRGVIESSELALKTPCYDIGLHLLHPLNRSFDLTLSNKIFEYLQAGLPVLLSNTTAHKELLERYPVGVVVQYGDPDSIENGLKTLIKEYSSYHTRILENRRILCWNNYEDVLIKEIQREGN